MAITSTTNRISHTGNGSTSVYSYPFHIKANTQLKVVVKSNLSPPTETTLTLTTDYTVSGVGDESGGNVTLVNASQAWLTSGSLKSGYEIMIRRVMPLTQTTDIRNQGDFLPETHEDQFDRAVMIAQQLQDQLDRCVKLSETVTSDEFSPTLPLTLTANKLLAINADGNGLTLGPTVSSTGVVPSNATVDRFSGTGSQTAFTLSVTPASENNTWVFVGGVYIQKNVYSISGTTLTFETAPASGTNNIEVVIGTELSIGTPGDGTVSLAKLATDTHEFLILGNRVFS